MSKFKFTFDLRDWKKGSELLHRLGFTDELEFKTHFELDLEEWQLEDLCKELQGMGLDFDFTEI